MPGPPSMVDTPPVASPVPPAQLYPTQSCAWPAYLVGFLLANYMDFIGHDASGQLLGAVLLQKFKRAGPPSSTDLPVRRIFVQLGGRIFRDELHSAQEFATISHRLTFPAR